MDQEQKWERVDFDNGGDREEYFPLYICPMCRDRSSVHTLFMQKRFNFCPNCGKKLKY